MSPDTPSHDPSLSRLYQEHLPAEPPAALDAAILAAAHAALKPAPRPWWQRLQMPVAVAATGLLAVMLTLTMERNPPEATAPPAESNPAAAEPAAPPKTTQQAAEASPPPVAKRALAMPPASPAAPAKPAEPPPAAPMRSAADAAPRPAAIAPEATTANTLADTAASRVRSNEALEKAAPAAAPQRHRMETRPLTPEAWLARIRSLREQGQIAEAAREWDGFRQAYPDHVLPEDLRTRPN